MASTSRAAAATVRRSSVASASMVVQCAGRFLVGLSIPLLAMGPSAFAHDPSEFNAKKWVVADYQGGITVWPDNSFPGGLTGTFFDRVQNGYQQWNAVCCVDSFDFTSGTAAVSRSFGPCQTDRDSIVFWENFTGALAQTGQCLNDNGRVYYVGTRFDSSQFWYAGTGQVGTNNFDFWGVATHEFGHQTGTWYGNAHFTSPISCPGNSTDQTMCPSLGEEQEKLRSLEAHDIDTFQNNYP